MPEPPASLLHNKGRYVNIFFKELVEDRDRLRMGSAVQPLPPHPAWALWCQEMGKLFQELSRPTTQIHLPTHYSLPSHLSTPSAKTFCSHSTILATQTSESFRRLLCLVSLSPSHPHSFPHASFTVYV